MVQGGASGSPVFLSDTGNVMGVVYASRLDEDRTEQVRYVVPTNFCHVAPSHFLLRILTENTSRLMESLPADAPNLDEIVASVPKEPTQKLTRGAYQKGDSAQAD